MIDVSRRVQHLDAARVHQRDPLADRHCLHLVMRHIDHGRMIFLVDFHQLLAGMHPQLRVQVGKRLIQQKIVGLLDHCPRQRHTLPLPAGQILRLSVCILCQPQHIQHLIQAPLDDCTVQMADLQPVGDILPDSHVRIDRVVLEDHGYIPFTCRHMVDNSVPHPDCPVRDRLEPGDHPEQRRLPAAGRTEQDQPLALPDLHAQILDDRCLPVFLMNMFQY